MAKPKSPLLSLGARGSVGGDLTFQKRGTGTIARTTPFPTDRYSLPQAYQRWLYEDYVYLWTKQDDATRATYRTAGARCHLTGFQYWMKYQLTNLPDILGMWHLDEKAGNVAHDSSRNLNHGTIIGATPIPGTIDGAQYFDGLNDTIRFTPNTFFDLEPPFTIEFFLTLHRVLGIGFYQEIFGKLTGDSNHLVQWNNTSKPRWFLHTPAGLKNLIGPALGVDNRTHITCTYDNINMSMFINGSFYALTPQTGAPIPKPTQSWYLASGNGATRFNNCTIDHHIIYSRICDATEILRHSLRRYPTP